MILGVAILFLLVKVAFKIGKDPDMKWYKRMKWHMKQIRLTLSNEPSEYSSKRIERMILFLNANIMVDIGFYILLQKDKIGAAELVLVYGAQMVYAGFQTKQIFKDTAKTKDEQAV